ncbi:BTB/POZ domain-containing protein [Ditylenchus destructor]|nr:BTB/POZ domain-containing protein [Ditylenchus destructor]
MGVELTEYCAEESSLGVYLFCLGALESTVYNTIYTARLIGRQGIRSIGGQHEFTGYDSSGWGWDSFIGWDILCDRSNGFMSPTGNVRMEMEFSAKRITQISPEDLHRFSSTSNLIHDAVLRIKGMRFHILSLYSPFFNTLFNSDFREKDEQEVHIEDTEPDDFIQLLNSVYPNGGNKVITEANVEVLLRLADRFLMSDVTERCEKFLIKSPRLSLDKKLLLAHDYNLNELQEYCRVQCKTKKANIHIICRTMEYKLLESKVKLLLWESTS